MHRTLDWLSRLVTARPWITLAVLVIVTVALGFGTTLRAPPLETSTALPTDSAVAAAMEEIEELFGESGEIRVSTLVFRGEALTPGGLAQMDAILREIATDPSVAGLLTPPDPIVAPSVVIRAALGLDSFESLAQARIDALRSHPEIGAALDAMTGLDTDGSPAAIGAVRLRDTGDERTSVAELRIEELASASGGPLRVSVISLRDYREGVRRGDENGFAPARGVGAAAGRRADTSVHALVFRSAAYARGADNVARLDLGRGGLVGTEWA